jgi:hypothetical protein
VLGDWREWGAYGEPDNLETPLSDVRRRRRKRETQRHNPDGSLEIVLLRLGQKLNLSDFANAPPRLALRQFPEQQLRPLSENNWLAAFPRETTSTKRPLRQMRRRLCL